MSDTTMPPGKQTNYWQAFKEKEITDIAAMQCTESRQVGPRVATSIVGKPVGPSSCVLVLLEIKGNNVCNRLGLFQFFLQ